MWHAGGGEEESQSEKWEGRFWFSEHPQLEMSVWIQLKCKMHKGAEEGDMCVCVCNYRLIYSEKSMPWWKTRIL